MPRSGYLELKAFGTTYESGDIDLRTTSALLEHFYWFRVLPQSLPRIK